MRHARSGALHVLRVASSQRRRTVGAVCAAVAITLAACGGRLVPLDAPEGGAVVVASDAALSFQKRVDGFYLRLAHRRLNSLETFNDFILRDHFQTPDLFFDYYADLAQAFSDAHFEQSRPFEVGVEEFLFEDGRTARVRVRFAGWDGRPLRPGRSETVRVDRWEWVDGTWWIRPGKL
jgi:hypothetical protein